MKQKFLKVFLFIIIIIVSDRVIGNICRKLYEKSNDFNISKLRYTLGFTKEDILIFGSSRAEYHFIPSIIRQYTGQSAYNCGIGGADLLFSRIQLNESLKRYKPGYIIIEASPSSFFIPNAQENRKMLLPFYTRDTLIYNTLTGSHLFEKTKFLSSIYPYNSTIASLLNGIIKSNTDSLSGYLPADGMIDTSGLTRQVNRAYGHLELPAENFTYLKQLIETCNVNDIAVIVVSTPVYLLNSRHDEMVSIFKTFCSQFSNLQYLDYSKHESTYGNMTLFKDNTHLNDRGAKIFSEVFAGDLKGLIKQKQ